MIWLSLRNCGVMSIVINCLGGDDELEVSRDLICASARVMDYLTFKNGKAAVEDTSKLTLRGVGLYCIALATVVDFQEPPIEESRNPLMPAVYAGFGVLSAGDSSRNCSARHLIVFHAL